MITTSRIGKIARLPYSIREQLNLKLHDGISAKSILPWLNSLPEVKAVLAADFDNRPISKQNLSEWKHGGHRDWLLQFHAAHFLQFTDSHSSSSSSSSSIPVPLTETQDGARQPQDPTNEYTQHATGTTNDFTHDTLGTHGIAYKLLLWTQLQYTTMARHIDSETDPERKWNALRQFATDVSRLRRSTLADDYLQIQRDWLALSQSNSTEKKEIEFCKWIKRPDIADAIKNKKRGLTRELLRKIEEEDSYLLGTDNPSLDEHIAQVRLAKELMAHRKAKEAEAKRQPGDPAPPPPDIKLRDTTFEELFPTIPDKPLTPSDPSAPSNPPGPSDPSAPSDPSDPSDQPALRSAFGEGTSGPVKPSQAQSNQIQPGSPAPEPNPFNDNPIPDN